MATQRTKPLAPEKLARLEKKSGRAFSERLRRFWVEEVGEHGDKVVSGLPGYTAEARLPVRFVPPSRDRFEEIDVDPAADPAILPLAELGDEAQFLAVNVSDPSAPVFLWENDDGKFHPVWPSLDAFLAALAAKPVVPPIRTLRKACDRADQLHEAGRYAEALAILEPVARRFPVGGEDRMDGFQGTRGEAFNLLGILLDDVGRAEEALAAWNDAFVTDCSIAAVNLVGFHERRGDPREVVRTGEGLKDRVYRWDEFPWFEVRKAMILAHLRLGERARADTLAREMHERYLGGAKVERIGELRDALSALAVSEPAQGAAVGALLEWFHA